jgi:hypothetical protein
MTTKLLACTLLAAACGSAHHTVDANRDTSTDTISPTTGDAPPGAVTIAITSASQPASNVTVYFQNADSSLVIAALTDAHGTVGAMLATGGFVTVIEPADQSGLVKLDTFAGVHSGDALHLDLAPAASQSGTFTDLTVGTDPSAFAYQAYSQCGAVALPPGGTGEVGFQGCGNTADLLVVAIDVDSNPYKAYYQPNVTIGPAPSDAMGRAADATGTFGGLATTAFSYTGVPSTIQYVATTQELWSPRGRLFDQSASAMTSGAAALNSFAQPAPTGLTAVTVTDAIPDPSTNANQHSQQLVFDWDTWSASYALKLDTVLLKPYLNDATYALDTHSITWMEGAGAQPDFVRARVVAYRDAIPLGTTWQWSIIAPRGMPAQIAFPKLPAADFDYNPTLGDTVSVADLTSVKAPGGYDSFRSHGFTDVKSLTLQGSTATTKLVVELPFSAQL